MTAPPRHLRRRLAAPTALVGALLLLAGCRDGAEQAGAAGATDPRPTLAMSHVLVSYSGLATAPTGLERSREEARERARRIAVLLRTDRGDLADLARRYSDDPTATHNAGYLGIFREGDLDPAIEAVVCSLEVGRIGGPVETAHGFHVVRREPVRRLKIHHLLVAHRDAVLADRHVRRDRAEAARIARALRRKAAAGDADLCELATRFSDDQENRQQCGRLGWVEPGMLAPTAERAVFSLEPGEISEVVESEYGFHIFWRD
ncbi:hypothetical protein GF314_04065 [bacterium]|nr:hypothetical protein [bacterium]